MVTYSQNEVIDILKRRQGQRATRKFASELGVSAQYLSEIYRGARPPGKRILNFLGLGSDKSTTVTYFELTEAK
jgi:transcriptional regulator with XRE-family HTH domain